MRLHRFWPEAFVVYMQGLARPTKTNPAEKRTGWKFGPGDIRNPDIRFVDAVVTDFKENHQVDRKRIYAAGFSGGCGFVFQLWAERPGTFAAFAPCQNPLLSEIELKVPRPAFYVAGKTDKVTLIESARATIDRLRKLNGATADGKPGDGGIITYESSKDAPVVTYIHPGGHLFPRESGGQLIVDFFRAHELKR